MPHVYPYVRKHAPTHAYEHRAVWYGSVVLHEQKEASSHILSHGACWKLMRVDMCVNMCADMCVDRCVDMCRRHV